MSELTPCNYCTLKYFKRLYEKDGTKIITRLATTGSFEGWIAVVKVSPDGTEEEIGWFMSLSNHCVC